MCRVVALPAAVLLASCCLTPASENDDAGPCGDCVSRDAGSADAGTCTGCPPPDAGTRCSSDAECPGGYCAMGLSSCPGATVPLVTVVPGYCHRDCQSSACVCQDAADCPLSAATGNGNPCGPGGQCAAFGADCPSVRCPAACPPSQPLESLCPVCLCAACPAPDAGSEPCTADTDCAGNESGDSYCELPLTSCPQPNPYGVEVTAAPGFCHRSCERGACACEDDADCPGGACNLTVDPPVCMGLGGDCGFFNGCPPECPRSSFAEDPCDVCLCATCPAPDAGSGGAGCGGGPDAGACAPNEVCCEVGGGGTGSISEDCYDLGPDGGCPPGAYCFSDDGGAVTSCVFTGP